MTAVSAFLAAINVRHLSADEPVTEILADESNFHYIYGNEAYRNDFYIKEVTAQHANDRDIYMDLHRQIGSIRPFFSELTYGLPTLARQKQVIAKQTTRLLPEKPYHEGYLEVGSTGRYLDSLEEALEITGERYFLSPVPCRT
jgi:hypothetical protein